MTQREKDIKNSFERQTLAYLDKKRDFSGVLTVKYVFRDGHLVSAVVKPDESHEEIKNGWQRLSDLR